MIDTIVRKHDKSLKNSDIKIITRATMAYLLRCINSSKLTEILHEYSYINPIAFRADLRKGYILKNLKLWLWYCLVRKLKISQAKICALKFKVDSSDFKLYMWLLSSDYIHELHKNAKVYKAYTLKTFENETQKIVSDLLVYTQKYAYKKLRFIMHGGGLSLHDIVCDLQIHGLEGMYTKYPKVDTILHLTNVYKSSIKNHGCNLIKQHTTQRHGVLISNKDGTFGSKKVSIDASESTAYIDQYSCVGFDGTTSDSTESKVIVQSLFQRVNNKFRKLLVLLTGEYNKKFSKYLKTKRINATNDIYYDKLMAKGKIRDYINIAAKFLGISPYRAHVVLADLRVGGA